MDGEGEAQDFICVGGKPEEEAQEYTMEDLLRRAAESLKKHRKQGGELYAQRKWIRFNIRFLTWTLGNWRADWRTQSSTCIPLVQKMASCPRLFCSREIPNNWDHKSRKQKTRHVDSLDNWSLPNAETWRLLYFCKSYHRVLVVPGLS